MYTIDRRKTLVFKYRKRIYIVGTVVQSESIPLDTLLAMGELMAGNLPIIIAAESFWREAQRRDIEPLSSVDFLESLNPKLTQKEIEADVAQVIRLASIYAPPQGSSTYERARAWKWSQSLIDGIAKLFSYSMGIDVTEQIMQREDQLERFCNVFATPLQGKLPPMPDSFLATLLGDD